MENDNTIEIKPCPFCGDKRIAYSKIADLIYYINCHATILGGDCYIKWNKRINNEDVLNGK